VMRKDEVRSKESKEYRKDAPSGPELRRRAPHPLCFLKCCKLMEVRAPPARKSSCFANHLRGSPEVLSSKGLTQGNWLARKRVFCGPGICRSLRTIWRAGRVSSEIKNHYSIGVLFCQDYGKWFGFWWDLTLVTNLAVPKGSFRRRKAKPPRPEGSLSLGFAWPGPPEGTYRAGYSTGLSALKELQVLRACAAIRAQ